MIVNIVAGLGLLIVAVGAGGVFLLAAKIYGDVVEATSATITQKKRSLGVEGR